MVSWSSLLLRSDGTTRQVDLPFYAARSDQTWKVRPETQERIPEHSPRHYMRWCSGSPEPGGQNSMFHCMFAGLNWITR